MECALIYPSYNKIDYQLPKRGTCNSNDGEEEVSVEPGRRCGHQRGRGLEKGARRTLLQMEGRQDAQCRIRSSITDPYSHEGFLQILREAAVSVRVHSRPPSGFPQRKKTRMSKCLRYRACWALQIGSKDSWLKEMSSLYYWISTTSPKNRTKGNICAEYYYRGDEKVCETAGKVGKLVAAPEQPVTED